MSSPWKQISAMVHQHQVELAAAEEGCATREWRFLGVHPVSGAWRAVPRRRPRLTVRELSFTAFVFALLEADELRQEEREERNRVRAACKAARCSFRGIHEDGSWVARPWRSAVELKAPSGLELRAMLAARAGAKAHCGDARGELL